MSPNEEKSIAGNAATGYSYFPGCSLTGSAGEYDASFRLVARELGIHLDEVEDWNCCGASPAPHHWGGNLGVLLPARNLHLASASHDAMVAPCAGCYNRFKNAQYQLEQSEDIRMQAERIFGEPVRYQTEILNLVQFFGRAVQPEALAERAQGRLAGIKLATYYGCLLTRPASILKFDNPRNPASMKPLLWATGAQATHFPFKSECCGSYMGLAKKEIVLRASRRIIEVAQDMGFDAIVTVCPLCHQNLDLRQEQINKTFGTSLDIPVLYFSQVLGLALGFKADDLGILAHVVSARKLIAKIERGGGRDALDGKESGRGSRKAVS
ncbi:MAG: CoB--CoM heterodisulfide reductase iron-sulfur subunit B family protein [Actinobacteria bacterium]|nr:CoB--CoM heterodisulfide reductase iron-sulfur subunit B family protein [Actinomycetota bacterium]MCL5883047.1 CoB--CoM heterodisulfide reductase iron-sulfur subunit B family protein [Actinomycetota bacterium]